MREMFKARDVRNAKGREVLSALLRSLCAGIEKIMDTERVEADIANCMDLLFLHLGRLDRLATVEMSSEDKRRLSRTANIFAARTTGLVKQANRVVVKYPRMT